VTGSSPEAQLEAREADRALAQAASTGDPQARIQLADRLLDRVRATAYYLAGGQDCEDLVQDCLVEIIAATGSFRGASRLETWADRIAVRTLRRGRSRRHRWRRLLHAEVDPEHLESGALPADRTAQQATLQRHLAKALAKISPQRRETFVLFAVHHYTARELAKMTDAPENTVRDRIKVARRQLRRHARRDPVLREWLEGGGR
jgi:RNA polymerase sigma-70 factor (ECF subfamily)